MKTTLNLLILLFSISFVAQEKPSDLITHLDDWSILLGDGTKSKSLIGFEKDEFFYTQENWVVFKTPNSGITSKTSNNTRSELGELKRWTPEQGAKLSATLKVMHVSESGDPKVAASYSVVVGQIHSDQGHENEPLKIFYKKFPGQNKGSLFWNYEINTEGDNSKRWDYSQAIWGYDMSVVADENNTFPQEPDNGIELGENFSYSVEVKNGIMTLTFTSEGHETVTFTKNLVKSDFQKKSEIPVQIINLYSTIGRDGVEKPQAYAGELQFFKAGAYNQSNGKDPSKNNVWNTGSNSFDGNIEKQYENGDYAEVWFKTIKLD